MIVQDEHLPTAWWKLGKVTKTFIGRDGKIKSREVKTDHFIIKRQTQFLYNSDLNDTVNSYKLLKQTFFCY